MSPRSDDSGDESGSGKARTGRSKQVFVNGIRQVAGTVPITKDGLVVLISSRAKSDEWILPKGGQENDEDSETSALRETWEEAGIRGTITREICFVPHTKIMHSGPACEFRFFEMNVEAIEDKWPEMDFRKRCVVSLDKALKLVRKEWMRTALEGCRLSPSNEV